MPRMDGLEFLSRLRQSPEHAGTPAILMTSADLSGDPEKARRLALERCQSLAKPMTYAGYVELAVRIKTQYP
jgi:CheY-like chemotaxis protein